MMVIIVNLIKNFIFNIILLKDRIRGKKPKFFDLIIIIILLVILYKYFILSNSIIEIICFILSFSFSLFISNKINSLKLKSWLKNILIIIMIMSVSIFFTIIYCFYFANIIECSGTEQLDISNNSNNNNENNNINNNKTSSSNSILRIDGKIGEDGGKEYDVNIKIKEGVKEGIIESIKHVVPNLGASGAGGAAASAIIKSLGSSSPLSKRIGAGALAGGITAAAVKTGVTIVDNILKKDNENKIINNIVKSVDNIHVDKANNLFKDQGKSLMDKNEDIGSPTDWVGSLIENENLNISSLEEILKNLIDMNIYCIILLLILLYLFIDMFIIYYNKNIIIKIINKFMPEKYKEKWIEKINKRINDSRDINSIFILLIILFISIVLFIIILFNIIINIYLLNNIDEYVTGYINIKNNKESILLLISNISIKKKLFIREYKKELKDYTINKSNIKIENENINILNNNYDKLDKLDNINNNEYLRFIFILKSNIEILDNNKEKEFYEINKILLRVLIIMGIIKDEESKEIIKRIRKDLISILESFKLKKNFIGKILNNIEINIKELEKNENSSIEIINEFFRLDKIEIKAMGVLDENEELIKEVDNYVEKNVINISQINNVNIPSNLINRLKNVMLLVLRINNTAMKKKNGFMDRFIIEINNCKYYSKKYSELSNREKNKSLQWTIEKEIKNLSSVVYVFIDIHTSKDLKRFKELILNVQRDLFESYINIITSLFKEYEVFNYNKKSMENIVNVRNKRKNEILNNMDVLNSIKDIKNLNEIKENEKEDNIVNKNSFLFNSNLYKKLHEIVNNNNLENFVKQKSIENVLLEYELNWFNLQLSDNSNINLNSKILHDVYNKINSKLKNIVTKFIRNNFELLLKNLESKNSNKNESITILLILFLGNERIINICFNYILSLLFNNENKKGINRTKLLFTISNRLFKTVSMIKINEENKIYEIYNHKEELSPILSKLIKKITLKKIQNLLNNTDEKDKFYLGDTMLNIILQECKIFEISIIGEFKDKEIFFKITEDYKHKLAVSSLNISHLPMLVPGNGLDENGTYSPYISPEINHVFNTFDSIIKNKFNNKIPTKNEKKIEKTINFLNKIKFTVNKKVYNFIINEWENKESKFFKGYNIKKEILEIDNKEEIKNKISHNSKYWNYYNTLAIASIFLNTEFYIPTFADFRGRIYPLINYLSYQGDDLNRSLLLFGDVNEELTNEGTEILLIYFANLCNQSKESLDYKLNWSQNNISNILLYFYNNKNEFDTFIEKLDEPFQFISILFDLEGLILAKKMNKKYISKNPILFDASCNGIQHLSALTREIDMAIKVNLISLSNNPFKDKPEDFYKYAASLIENELNINENENYKNINIHRNIIKKTVMTIPYNISLTGVGSQLNEFFPFIKEGNKNFIFIDKIYTKNKKEIFLTPKEFGNLTKIIFNVLTKKMPSLNTLSLYLDSLINIISALNKPIVWITPSGLIISLSTIKYKNIITKTKLIKTSKPVTISLPTSNLDKIKIRRSFMPNLIHSLDASNIHLLIEYIIKYNINIKNIFTIHDCFATTANKMYHLERLIKLAFIKIYFSDGNYLEKMHDNIINQIKSYSNDIYNIDGKDFIKINNINLEIPKIPDQFINKDLAQTFIDGIVNSAYFIK